MGAWVRTYLPDHFNRIASRLGDFLRLCESSAALFELLHFPPQPTKVKIPCSLNFRGGGCGGGGGY